MMYFFAKETQICLVHPPTFSFFKRVLMVANAVMPQTDETLRSLVTKNSVEFLGEVHFPKREEKTRRQSGQNKQGKNLRPGMSRNYSLFGHLIKTPMWQEFLFVVQCKTQCRLNLQIEIPDESPRWTSTLTWRHFQLWHLLLFISRVLFKFLWVFFDKLNLTASLT